VPMQVLGLLLAAKKPVDIEGRDIILSMLVVGLVFLGVVVLGELTHYIARRRRH
jgi:hypothetical protein